MEALPCTHLVYRAMARKNWIDKTTGAVMPAAFMRRDAPKDDDGLSVDVESPQSCAAALNDCYGVASLHVGRVRDIGLDVEVDEYPHANITRLPRNSEDAKMAERLASQLAKQARSVPPGQVAAG